MLNRVYVEITNVCNLACSFCPGTERAPRFMSPQKFGTIADRLLGVTGYLYLHVLGEPLLHPGLTEILSAAGKRGFRVCLTTNGTLLGTESGKQLEDPCLHKVSVSLHSFEGNGRKDSLETYLSGVLDFCLRASARGVICALRLWNRGGEDLRNSEIESFLSRRLAVNTKELPADPNGNRKLGQNLYLESAERFDWPDLSASEQETQFCHALRQQIAVLCDGTVVPCCLDAQGAIPLGNLLEQGLEEILSSPRAKAMERGFAARQPAEELCRRCGYARRFNR